MIQAFIRYLGLDEETKRVRQEAQRNLDRAGQALEQLQLRLVSTSRTSDSSREKLSRTMRDSEFNFGKRRRATGA